MSPLAAGCTCPPNRLLPDCPVHGSGAATAAAAAAKLIPELDNHHNAWLCPYCMATRRGELAQAWEQGYTSGHSNAMRQMSDEPDAPTTANPYLDTGKDQS